MKKWILALGLVLLLAGCRQAEPPMETVNPAPTPAASLLPTPTAAPLPLEEMEPWWTGVELDKLPTQEEPVYQVGDVTWRVTCAEPKLDLTLYDVSKGDLGVQFVLRHGDALGEVYRAEGVSSDCFYSLHEGDYDGDGEQEFIVGMYRQFLLCELDGEDGFSSLVYGSEQFIPQIQSALTVQRDRTSVTLYCGGSSASYRLGEGIDGEVAFSEEYDELPLWFNFSNNAILAVFPMNAYVKGTTTGGQFATLRYTLAYDGERLTPQKFYLEELAGV